MINTPREKKNPIVGYEHYKEQLTWQLSVKWPIVLFCEICYWGSSDLMYQYCPYGHGEMADIEKFISEITEGI